MTMWGKYHPLCHDMVTEKKGPGGNRTSPLSPSYDSPRLLFPALHRLDHIDTVQLLKHEQADERREDKGYQSRNQEARRVDRTPEHEAVDLRRHNDKLVKEYPGEKPEQSTDHAERRDLAVDIPGDLSVEEAEHLYRRELL